MSGHAYKYRSFTASQENLLRQTMGCVGLVYNKALSTRTKTWDEN
ncbi:MAG: helix-turn-helix domain-containing protein [Cyanobacteria bacterium P01_F01_bin.143]